METKKCTKCGEIKPKTSEFFGVVNHRPCGFRGECKSCYKKYDAIKYEKNKAEIYARSNLWRLNNPERVKERAKKYVAEDPERYREYKRKYSEQNREVLSIRSLAYRAKNIDKEKARQSRYRMNNRDKGNVAKLRRRTLKKNLQANFTVQDWKNTLSKFGNECAYCGESENLSQDHFLPLTKGGEYTINNIIPACFSCNSSKHNKLFAEWYPQHKCYMKQRELKILNHLGYRNDSQQLALF